MSTLRIVFGICLDVAIFGFLVPGATLLAGARLDAAFFPSIRLDGPFYDLLGAAFILAGLAWLFWASWLLIEEGRGYLTELFGIQVSPVTQRLVTRGPFGVHRHPICVGYLAALSGLSLIPGLFGSLALAIPLLLVLTWVYLRAFEEPGLIRRFGAGYRLYAGRVPMFLPAGRPRIRVALRNLQADRLRFSLSVLGVAFAILLICFQLSILKGARGQITTYIDHTGADLWAMQKGVDDFIAFSAVPRKAADDLARLEGVERAVGIYAVYTLLEINRVKSRVYVIGYDTRSGDGGPWKLGPALPHLKNARQLEENEVLLDENLARRHGLGLGDEVSLFGRTFKLAGFTLETTSIGSQYVFLPRDTVGEILPGGGLSFTHILLWKTKAVSDEALIRRVETDFRLNCLTRARFGDNTRGFLGMFMLPLLTAGMLMGFLVGCITIGITLYTSVLERFKEYGTMKALGATGPYLYGLLLKQALISLGVGAALGFVLAMAANRFINEWVPGMTAGLDGAIALETMAAGLAMVGLSTALPMWRLIKIDPMEAFRA